MTGQPTPTGVLFLNMGDPSSLDEVLPFLTELLTDREIMRVPFQDVVGPLAARARARHARHLYETIGGGSPLTRWNLVQLRSTVTQLDVLSPATAPHRGYLAFRYTAPRVDTALAQMRADGVRRAVAFPQYPQYSCATSGSSLNDLNRAAARLGLQDTFQWSVVDRWHDHPAYLAALGSSIVDGLERFAPQHRDEVVVLFSAHSLPSSIVNRGDPYLQAIGATVEGAVQASGIHNRYALAYQSKVGPASWQGPSTIAAVTGLPARGVTRVLVVPVSFTSDHIETLSEIDIELAETARRAGVVELHRAPALNDRRDFLRALAEIVSEHLHSGRSASAQFDLRCSGCPDPACRRLPGAPVAPPTAAVSTSTGSAS